MKAYQDAAWINRLRAHRRALHRIPEEGWQEELTQAYLLGVLRTLTSFRIEPLYKTGFRAVLRAPGAVRTIAFRADMDALAACEPEGKPYASAHPGMMHACGHDGHMAVLLTLAEYLDQNAANLAHNVVLIFQPAEESVGGAKKLIECGAMRDPDVDEVYALHMAPHVPKGAIATRPGVVTAQTTEFDIEITGKSAHGAMPEKGIDAVVAAASLIGSVQTIFTRSISPREAALITFGRIEGGTRRNILAERVLLEGTVRTFGPEVYALYEQRLDDMLRGLERMYGVKARVIEHVRYPSIVNDAAAVERVRAAAEKAGAQAIEIEPAMVAEDFSYFLMEAPGAIFWLGCCDEDAGLTAPLHSSLFDFDEDELSVGLAIFCNLLGI